MKQMRPPQDLMTPVERRAAMDAGRPYDRVPCIPFMGEFKCQVSGNSVAEIWHDPQKMAETEIAVFNKFGHDRLMIGPNTYGISEALGLDVTYMPERLPDTVRPCLDNYSWLDGRDPVDAEHDKRIRVFLTAAEILAEEAVSVVPVEASIGGPFTIASLLRGTELLLRDCIRNPEKVHALMRLITDSEKSCVKAFTKYGLGIAMADPVANPSLIGPKLYEQFVFPYHKELTDYVYSVSGKRVSLHMCGKTYKIWKYFRELTVNEVSLDNIIELRRAVEELSDVIPIAGNVPPVEVIMQGTREEIFSSVKECIAIGRNAGKGFTLTTGCEVPFHTEIQKVEWFMEAARNVTVNR